ncbi:hypothetical protein, partial [Klebsiella pneumoniae]|uniref:hypothetical protein n=1 Tax=Klebsiella pneumoniae TaxID=573 RepID=UPI0013D69207
VKRELRDETKRLRGIISGEAAAHKVQLQLAHDANARLIADKVDLIRSHTQALNLKDERIVELIRGHAGVIASKDARISELFRSNN